MKGAAAGGAAVADDSAEGAAAGADDGWACQQEQHEAWHAVGHAAAGTCQGSGAAAEDAEGGLGHGVGDEHSAAAGPEIMGGPWAASRGARACREGHHKGK